MNLSGAGADGGPVFDRVTLAAVAVSLLALASLLRWLLLRRRAGLLHFGGTPSLALAPAEAGVFVLILSLGALCGGFGLTFAAIAGVAAALFLNGVPLGRHFGPGPLTVPQVFLLGLWIVAAVFAPLQLLSGGCEKVFQHFGWPTPLEPAISLFLDAHGWKEITAIVLMAIIVAPVGEEMFFRGFLQPLLKRRLPAWVALLVTALLFAALHRHAVTFLPLFGFGLVLGLAYELSDSLLLCMAIHFWFNGITALLLATGNGPTP